MATKTITDCATGQTQTLPLSQAEQSDFDARVTAAATATQAEQTKAAQRVTDLTTLRAKAAADPTFAAPLLRYLGIQ